MGKSFVEMIEGDKESEFIVKDFKKITSNLSFLVELV